MKVNISEIENKEDNSEKIEFREIIEEFNKSAPIEASLEIKVLDKEFVTITGTISAQLNLVCDSCLKEFTQKFLFDINETYARYSLYDEYKEEVELKEGSFVEDLNGNDEIDITDLVYQSVILNLPNKLVCDINCIGEEKLNKHIKNNISDPRLDIFKSIKIEKDS